METHALVVDDHKMVCEAVAALVEKSSLIDKVYLAFSGAQALEMLKLKHIHVAIIDVRMPGISGLDLFKMIFDNYWGIKVIGMTSFEDDTVMDMLRAPVQGVLLKSNTNGAEITQCLFEILNGRTYFTPEVQTKINTGQYNLTERSRTTLTEREYEILVYISKGKSAKEIADKLGVKVTTIEDNRKAMLRKTHTANVAELMAFSHRNGLL